MEHSQVQMLAPGAAWDHNKTHLKTVLAGLTISHTIYRYILYHGMRVTTRIPGRYRYQFRYRPV